jgi:PAS domain S-box-containing protein
VNVLVVDDRPDKLLALSAMLEAPGLNVVTAPSGAEALRCLLRADFAVILLDVHMPQMDGLETAQLVRRRGRSEKTPIIFLTAVDAAQAQAARGYALGAVDYLQMPVPRAVLQAKVAAFVDLHRRSEQIRQQAELLRAAEERGYQARLAEAADRLDMETRRNRFFTLAPDMLGIAGFDGQLLQINPSWEQSLGFGEAELREAPFVERLHPDDQAQARQLLRRLAEGTAPTVQFEARHRHRSGSYRWIAWTAAAFPEEGLLYLFASDVTFRKAAEQEQLHLVREQEGRRSAERENALKDEFLAILSHELRAPLTPILAWTSLLQAGRLDEEASARALGVIERNARHQAQLIEDLLDVSRIVSGKLRVERRPADLRSVVEEGLEPVRAAAAERQQVLLVRLPETPVWARVDSERLRQVVWNLAANAVKFSAEAGQIEVVLEADDGQARLTVSDQGLGISPEFLPQVFDRFRQADSGTARAHGGLGLGLAIVRHLVEAHGGSVEAHSEGLHRGARFSVRLPLTPVPDDGVLNAEPARPLASAPVRLDGVRVLVVDDDAQVCDVLSTLFQGAGAEVRVAGSASEAGAALGEAPSFHLLVSDVAMPGGDGYDLVRGLRQGSPAGNASLPAIALTACASPEDAARALAAGFQVHLSKPVDPARVLQAAARLAWRS